MNDISFKSKIRFVNSKAFEKFEKGVYVDFRKQQELNELAAKISKSVQKPFESNQRTPRLDIVKADEFFIETLRTCTGGLVVDKSTGEAAGFHFYDCLFNYERVDEILDNIFALVKNPDKALLIGSNNLRESLYSVPFFQKLYDGISKRVENVTIFREHIFPYSESNLHYSLNDDTCTIQSMYRPLCHYKEFDVTSEKDLRQCFKEVKIADGDVVEFYA